ncbi:MFS general substrate transporter [Hortaea werneckii]|nr:MFS general substrate transporter [Hortaea werneckii]
MKSASRDLVTSSDVDIEPHYQSRLSWGGHVGEYIAKELLNTGKHSITALTRKGSKSNIPKGLHIAEIDYEDPSTIVEALKGHDALVITLGGAAPPDLQSKLIQAAAEAEVHWILPNEWSPDTAHEALLKDVPIFAPKANAREEIERTGGKCSYISVVTGFWYEWSLAIPAAYGCDFINRTFTFFDDGEIKTSMSTWPQVGRTVARLLSLPLSPESDEKGECLEALKNNVVYVRSFTISQKDMFASALRATGTQESDWQIKYEPAQERFAAGLEAMKAGDRLGFAKMLYSRIFFSDGVGNFEASKGTVNEMLNLPEEDLDEASRVAVRRYDALSHHGEASQATHPTGGKAAYKVGTYKRFAQVVFTVVACWLASGIVFGFAALKPVLISEGVYRELCTPEELEADVEVCYAQDLRMNFFFAVASTTCNVSALPVGTILDRYGPRVCAVIGSFCLAVGSILMGYAFKIPEFDGYIMGNVFLALGGTFVFLPSFSIANAFPMYAGTIVATVTGAFDASAAVFLFYRIIYEATEGRFTPEKFFFAYLVVPAIILVAQVTLMTPDGYKSVPQLEAKYERAEDATRDVHDSDDELSDNEVRKLRAQRREHRESKLAELDKLLGDADFREAREHKEEERHAASGVWGALHGRSAREQMLSPWFILMTLLTVLQMLRMNFFIATIRTQYEVMLGSEKLSKNINSFFDVALPVGGVAATPFIGMLLDNASTGNMLAVLVALVTLVGFFGSLPFYWAGFVNVIFFVLLRPLYYSAMSDYATKVFGFATFGKIYGTIICLSGLVNLFQPAIDALNYDAFHGNPIPINAFFAILGTVIGIILVVFVQVQGRKVMKQIAKEEEALERRRGVPESIAESEFE